MPNDAAGAPVNIGQFQQVLSEVAPEFAPAPAATRTLEPSAFYDFAYYEFLFPTEQGGYRGALSDRALATLDDLQASLGTELAALMLDVLTAFEQTVRDEVRHWKRGDWDEQQVVADLLDDFYRIRAQVMPDLLTAYRTEVGEGIGPYFLKYFLAFEVHYYLRTRLYIAYPSFFGFWSAWATGAIVSYAAWHAEINQRPPGGEDLAGFLQTDAERWRDELKSGASTIERPYEVFTAGSINLGICLVYRQDWLHLGTQPGEIVRTIPLGPGQTERITTKVTRRQKRVTTLDQTETSESETESTDSTKDSSEIVREAASSFNWNVSAQASASFFVGSASISTSLGGTSEDKSRNTSASLSEAMRKTSSKTRRETKVSVVTESEETLETERFSDIKNPNNESAITYEFLKLQHQYEVFTRLAEMQTVVYVAERLPDRVDADWTRQHDWIIAGALRDNSLRQSLNELIQQTDQTQVLDPDQKLTGLLDKSSLNFATFAQNPAAGQGGLSIPDIYSGPARLWQEENRASEERRRANALRNIRAQRLIFHIEDNLLHYCQAIWRQEGSDQRMLRYKKENRQVPIEWRGPLLVQQPVVFGAQSGAQEDPADFTPTGREAPLWQVIDPSGPIGYIGNYAKFQLRPLPPEYRVSVVDPRASKEFIAVLQQGELLLGINEILALLGRPYLGANGALRDPARDYYDRQAALQPAARLRALDDEAVFDVVSYLPRLASRLIAPDGSVLRAGGNLGYQITAAEWGEYLYRKNNSRRFLVDSNNLYMNIRVSGGAALEPYKRAHRLIDVAKEYENYLAIGQKNARRARNLDDPRMFDPDIEKVIVVGADAQGIGNAAIGVALGGAAQPAGGGASAPGPAGGGGADAPPN